MNVPDTSETEKVLGPLPDGRAEEPQRFPGGADSVADETKYGEIPDAPLVPDVPPRDNPATSAEPEGVSEADDKPQAPEGDREDREANTPDPGQQTAQDSTGGEPGEQPTEPES